MGEFTTQVGVLLRKDFIQIKRHVGKTVCCCLAPSIMLMLVGWVVFLESLPAPRIQEFSTMEGIVQQQTQFYSFDPFPKACANMEADSVSAAAATGNARWGYEPRGVSDNHSKLDCMVSALSSTLPFWRDAYNLMKADPFWEARPQVFAVSPGTQDDATTTGGRFAAWLNERFDSNFRIYTDTYQLFNDECFNKTAPLRVKKFAANGDFDAVNGTATNMTVSFCVQNPYSCLQACNSDSTFRGQGGILFADLMSSRRIRRQLGNVMEKQLEDDMNGLALLTQSERAQIRRSTRAIGAERTAINHALAGEDEEDDAAVADGIFASISANYRKLEGERQRRLRGAGGRVAVSSATGEDDFSGGAAHSGLRLEGEEGSSLFSQKSLLRLFTRRRLGGDGGAPEVPGLVDEHGRALEFTTPLRALGDYLWHKMVDEPAERAVVPRRAAAGADVDAEGGSQRALQASSSINCADYETPDACAAQRTTGQCGWRTSNQCGIDAKWVMKVGEVVEVRPSQDAESNKYVVATVTKISYDAREQPSAVDLSVPWGDGTPDKPYTGVPMLHIRKRFCGRCQAKKITSCWESWSQLGDDGETVCDPLSVWRRMGHTLRSIRPYVKVYGTETELNRAPLLPDYPGNLTATVTGKKTSFGTEQKMGITVPKVDTVAAASTVTYSGQLCGAITFTTKDASRNELYFDVPAKIADAQKLANLKNGELYVSIRTNSSSSTGTPYGFKLGGSKVTYRPQLANGARSAYAQSEFMGLQMMANEWLRCRDSTACYGADGTETTPLSLADPAGSDAAMAGGLDPSDILMTPFATPREHVNFQLTTLGSIGGASQMWFGLCLCLLPLMGRVLQEKENKIREGMKQMGLRDSAFYFATCLYHFLWSGGATIFVTVCYFVLLAIRPSPTHPNEWGVARYSNFLCFWLALWLIVWATLQFANCLTVFFPSGRGKIFIMAIVLLLFSFIDALAGDATGMAKKFWMLIPAFGMAWFVDRLFPTLEQSGEGVNFSTMSSMVEDISVGDIYGFAVLSVLFWTFLHMYLDQTWPQGLGVPRKPWFLCTSKFWQQCLGGARKGADVAAGLADDEANLDGGVYFEAPDANHREMMTQEKCVKVRKLKKDFTVDGRTMTAVNEVDFTMYQDEVFVLLGHNGAGKTTTFSMLTGLLPETSGGAMVYGRSLDKQLALHRNEVGICPQFSVLWDDLTVMEHLLLFASFKGVPTGVARKQAEEILREQYMLGKKDTLAGTLSGGYKRKLSLAIAFMGDPKLVFLDEPSSGMDSAARRESWDLIMSRKQGRVIVLTTHYMDEADVVADRVAIMSHGKVKCMGTTNFLKNAYGCGYNISFNLSVTAKPEAKRIWDFLTKQIPGFPVKLMSTAGRELLFLVPFEASAAFETCFDAIEAKKEEFQILSWNLLVCNLEEVFLKVASEEEAAIGRTKAALAEGEDDDGSPIKGVPQMERAPSKAGSNMSKDVGGAGGLARTVTEQSQVSSISTGSNMASSMEVKSMKISYDLAPATGSQLAGLLKKRYLNAKRSYATTLCQLLCPLVLVIAILGATLYGQRELARLELDYNQHFNLENEVAGERKNLPCTLAGYADHEVTYPYAANVTTADWKAGFRVVERSGRRRHGAIQSVAGEEVTVQYDGETGASTNTTDELSLNYVYAAHADAIAADAGLTKLQQVGKRQFGWTKEFTDAKTGGIGSRAVVLEQASLKCPYTGANNTCTAFGGGAGFQFGASGLSGKDQEEHPDAGECSKGGKKKAEQAVFGLFPLLRIFGFVKYAGAAEYLGKKTAPNVLTHLQYWMEGQQAGTATDEASYGAFVLGGSQKPAAGGRSDKIVNVMYNMTGVHVMPVMLQEMYNYLNLLGRGGDAAAAESTAKIMMNVKTLPLTEYEASQQLNTSQFSIGFNLLLAFAFVSCFGLVFIVMEKELEIKMQQFVNGVGISLYWVSNLLFDFSLYIFPVFSVIAVCAGFSFEVITGNRTLGGMIALLLLYGCAQPSFSYAVAHLFKSQDNALSVALGANIIVGFTLFLAGFILEIASFGEDVPTRLVLYQVGWILRLWPVYALAEGLRRVLLVGSSWISTPPETRAPAYWEECAEKFKKQEVAHFTCSQNIFDQYGVGPAVTSLVFDVIIWLGVVLFIDWAQQDVGIRQRMQPKGPSSRDDPINLRGERDADVIASEQAIAKMKDDEQAKRDTAIYLKDVSKVFKVPDVQHNENRCPKCSREVYGACCNCPGVCCVAYPCFDSLTKKSREVNAVRDCSLSLQKGEVLGLLGANGAGKTTLFRLMCGVEAPCPSRVGPGESTEIYVGGKNMFKERAECRQLIGYTAQENPIWKDLTVVEHLNFYAKVKGVPANKISEVVDAIIHDMTLEEHRWKRAGNLSGGNKRKLVIAMSLIGTPKILFLDEPSAGMDPEARRNLWSIIRNVATKKKDSTVIITTHSMDECEALCSKVVIMANGVQKCMGSVGRIKQLYGKGYDFFSKFAIPSAEEKRALALQPLGLTNEEEKKLYSIEDFNKLLSMSSMEAKANVQQLLYSKSSPFPTTGRLSAKNPDTLSDDERRVMATEQVKLSVLAEWCCLALWRVGLCKWACSTFEGAELLEIQQGGRALNFRISGALVGAAGTSSDSSSEEQGSGTDKEKVKHLGALFGQVERSRAEYHVQEYAITPTTLEQIFNRFTRDSWEHN